MEIFLAKLGIGYEISGEMFEMKRNERKKNEKTYFVLHDL
jgi:hypothetical protein